MTVGTAGSTAAAAHATAEQATTAHATVEDGTAPAERCVVALDVGGTTMKGALLDGDARVRARRSFATGAEAGTDAVLGRIADAFEQLAGLAPEHGLAAPTAAGLAVPGVVDEANGIAVTAANVPFSDTPLAAPLRDRLGIDVRVGHDVRAGGLAESVLGAAAGATNVLFLPLGTGIAAACIVDGRALTAGGYAGEIGHVVIDPDGDPCNCGNRGCLERIASASAVARRYTAASGHQVDGAEQVAELVRAGDPVAREIWDETVDALVVALRLAVTLLGSEVVIIGGGLGEAGALLRQPLDERLGKALTFQRRPTLVPARLGDQAGCLGAGLLALELLPELRRDGEGDRPRARGSEDEAASGPYAERHANDEAGTAAGTATAGVGHELPGRTDQAEET